MIYGKVKHVNKSFKRILSNHGVECQEKDGDLFAYDEVYVKLNGRWKSQRVETKITNFTREGVFKWLGY